MRTLEELQKEIIVLNNTLDDEYFIEMVNAAGEAEYFENATYDTIEECKEYIEKWNNIFTI